MATKHITEGSRTVVINEQNGIYRARLWVNCANGELGDATLVARKFKSEKGAEDWAQKALADRQQTTH